MIVLDASAVIAMLLEEPGGDAVAAVLPEAQMTAVNHAEIVSHFVYSGMPMTDVKAMLMPLPVAIMDVDHDLADTAGALRQVTARAGLSLGDRFCLALALHEDASVWTTDRRWSDIADEVGVKVHQIR